MLQTQKRDVISCKVFFGEGLFRLGKGIFECCVDLKQVLVFLTTGRFRGRGSV